MPWGICMRYLYALKKVAMPPTDTQRAFELLRNRIVTTQMLPGTVIQEAALIADLGLGRTPIREALKLLEAQLLVHVSPRRGIFVAPINIADLVEIQEIRAVLDPLCVRLAATRITPTELAALQELVTTAKEVEAREDVGELLRLDQRFHQLLVESTRNQLLQLEIERLYDLSLRIWHYYLDRTSPEDLAIDALEDVVDALRRTNVVQAERAMIRHIQHFGDSIRRCL
jgi:DNA-binding GntR family transcriptional regulator